MELVYRQRIPQRLYTFFICSIFIHLGLVLFINTRRNMSSNLFITEITYQEEVAPMPEGIKPQARIGYLIPPKEIEPSGAALTPDGAKMKAPVVNLDIHLDRSQAKIDIERYEAEDKEGMTIVRIADRASSTVKSTDEILAEKPISLAKNIARSTSAGIGQPTMQSDQAELSAIKLEKKLPLIKPQTPSKEVETRPDQQLKIEKGKTQISLAGSIAQRNILQKVLPQYPTWCLRKNISGVVKVRIWVEPSGTLRAGSLIETSSGFPDLDQSVINAIKNWHFAPLPQDVLQETQSGVITFRFVLG